MPISEDNFFNHVSNMFFSKQQSCLKYQELFETLILSRFQFTKLPPEHQVNVGKLETLNSNYVTSINKSGAFVQKLQFVISFIFNPLRAKNDIHYDRGRDFVNGSGYFCTCLTANRLVCNKVIQILEFEPFSDRVLSPDMQ